MTGLSPMLACGSITFPPWLNALALAYAVLWLATFIVAIPNLLMSLQRTTRTKPRIGNIIFFIAYFLASAGIFTGWIFEVNIIIGVALVLLVPLLGIGHFIYLFRGWRRERKAKRTAESVVRPEPPEGEARAVE